MLFEPKPKEFRKDLFNFDEEIDKVVNELHDPLTRMIVIRGLRRTGKSSILRVALNEAKYNYILLDMREFEDIDRRGIAYEISEALTEVIKGKKKFFSEHIRAISFLGMRIDIKPKNQDPVFRYKLLMRKINAWARKRSTFFVIAIDEAQEIAKINFDSYLAFIYDNLSNIKIVLTGSQVGLLTHILDNPKKPLFGRARVEITTKYLTKEESKEFLTRGFTELNMRVDTRAVNLAVNRLNGVIGWLTLYGWYIYKGSDPEEAMDKVIELGSKTVREELQGFLYTRGVGGKRYTEVLKILAEGPKRWKEVKTLLEIRLRRTIPNNQITKYLTELRKYGFIVKKENRYLIPDPILKYTLISKL